MLKYQKRKIAYLSAMAALLLTFIMPAAADMMIMPVRVIFKDGERMKGLSAINTGNTQALYRLELSHKKQIRNGSYQELEGPLDPNFDMSKWLVYSPRQVDLPPQGKQAIRMSMRRPPDLPDGEYRLHAKLSRVSKDKTDRDAGVVTRRGATPGYDVNVGFAVPVVLRKGKYDTTVSIQNMSYIQAKPTDKDKRNQVILELHRKGKFSSMGQVVVYWTPAGGGEEKQAGVLNNMTIYPELDIRDARVYLDEPVSGGTFRVVYQGTDADKGIKFDEKTFPFPG